MSDADEIEALRWLLRRTGEFTLDEDTNRISEWVTYDGDGDYEPVRFDDPVNDITPEMAGVIRRALRSSKREADR